MIFNDVPDTVELSDSGPNLSELLIISAVLIAMFHCPLGNLPQPQPAHRVFQGPLCVLQPYGSCLESLHLEIDGLNDTGNGLADHLNYTHLGACPFGPNERTQD
ncbi:Uncharacterised protein [Mycobacterium tuberculosis]|nr:Uncharacterised protein [Mycobacterium tuberculosis]